MTPAIRTSLLLAFVVILAVVAVAGWTRTPSAAPAYATSAESYAPQPLATAQPVNYDQNAYVAPNPPACVEPSGYVNDSVREVRTYRQPARMVRTTYVEPQRTYVTTRHRGRSWKKSVAIVAGTGGVGAAIGALAGGGRGAAIGGLAGGGAGFLYDRLTHKRVN